MAGLTESEIAERLAGVPGWERSGKEIARVFEFEAFGDGIKFVTRVAAIADEMDHHPDIDVRYTKVRLALTSHDTGGLTDRDFRLASRVDNLS